MVWTLAEKRAWKLPPRRMAPEWAEENRYLTRAQTERYGKWTHRNTPYGVGILEALGDPDLDDVVIQKAAQVGASEIVRCWIGYVAERDPDPLMLIWPTEHEGKKIFRKRIIPLFQDTPCLKPLYDAGQAAKNSLTMVQLSNGFLLRLSWAGSPSTLKSDPIRFVVADEVDEFPAWTGRNADPVSMARKRTRTYGRRTKRVWLSTPTTEDGQICRLREAASLQVRYFVPCPHCGRYQLISVADLVWEGGQDADPDELVEKRAVKARCQSCDVLISEARKPLMIQRGIWATEETGPRLGWDDDAERVLCHAGELWRPGGLCRTGWSYSARSIGFHLPGQVCLWVSWSEIIAEKLEAGDDPMKLMDWVNQTLGDPFRLQVKTIHRDSFERKSDVAWPEGVVPVWATHLLATADVQEDHCYVVIRAWDGDRLRSRRVWHGRVTCNRDAPDAFDELHARVFGRVFESEGEGGPVAVDALGIDRGYRTDEVDRYARRDLQRIYPLKGANQRLAQWTRAYDQDVKPRKDRPRAQLRPRRYDFDSDRCKTWLANCLDRRIEVREEDGQVTDHDFWELNSRNDQRYNAQMTSERKVAQREGGKLVERWVAHGPNHYLDCEAMQRALVYVSGCEASVRPRKQLAHWSQRRKRTRRIWR